MFSGDGCTYSVKAYDAAGCTGTLLSSGPSGILCRSGKPKSFRVTAGTVTNAACGPPQGGEAKGSVVVGNPITVCCKP
jgi:hypothetical protein